MPEAYVPKPFRCDISRRDGVTHVEPEGDLDMSTVDELDGILRRLVEDGATQVIVDLRGLGFMDSTGITLLTRWNTFASRDGFELALIQGNPRIARLFSLTGLGDYFTFADG
jgi:anti-sigma B factor antagonist